MSQSDRTESVTAAAAPSAWSLRIPSLPIRGWVLGALVGLSFGVYVGVGAIGDLLVTMHPPSLAGRGLAQGFGTNGLGGGVDAAAATFEAWRSFDSLGFSVDVLSPFTLARVWLIVDYAFTALYAVTLLALARPSGPLASGGTGNTLAATRVLVIAVAVTDALENSLALRAVSAGSAPDGLFQVLFVTRVVKVFVFTLPLGSLLLLVVLRKLRLLLGEPRIRQGLVMARTQILATVVLSLALWYEPTSDVLLDVGTSQTLALLVFGGLLCAGLGIGARVLIDRDRVAYSVIRRMPNEVVARFVARAKRKTVGSIMGLLIAGTLAVLGWATGWRGLRGGALVIVSVVAASWVLQDSETRAPDPVTDRSTARLPAVLGLAPLGLLGIALVHWTLWADIVLGHVPLKAVTGLLMAAGAGALLAPIGRVVAEAQTTPSEQYRPTAIARPLGSLARSRGAYRTGTWIAIVTVLTVPAVLLLFGTRFVDVRYLGPLSLVFGAVATLNLVGTWLVIGVDWWRDEFGLPSVFKALRMRRIPVFLLAGFWLVVNAFAFADPSYYDVATGGTNRRVTLQDAYADWKQANLSESSNAVPLVVVAAEGGGLRAAYWTERVLTELFDGTDVQPFALSGTSGGSVGIATYLAKRELGDSSTGGVGLADVPDPDFLSAVFHRWFTLDLVHSLMRQPRTVGDRAGALADALTAEIPLLGLPYDYAPPAGGFQPVTVFNSADLQDGCLAPITTLSDLAGPAVTSDDLGCLDPDRSVVRSSRAAGFPGAADIAFGCSGQGMTFATAAVASSRSPYVTPAGRLENCLGHGVFYLADGGYVDNSGALAAAVILERIEAEVAEDNATGGPCVVPILLQIDNGAESLIPGGQATGNPSQITVVLTGAVASSSSRHDINKVAAAALVQQPLTDADGREVVVTRGSPDGPRPAERYVRIFPLAQAGRDATVGWLLSQPSKDALETQLEAAIADAQTLLSDDAGLACG